MTVFRARGEESRGGYLWRVLTDYHRTAPDDVGKAPSTHGENAKAIGGSGGAGERGSSGFENIYRFTEAIKLGDTRNGATRRPTISASTESSSGTTPLRLVWRPIIRGRGPARASCLQG